MSQTCWYKPRCYLSVHKHTETIPGNHIVADYSQNFHSVFLCRIAFELFPNAIKKFKALLPKFLTMQKQQFIPGRNVNVLGENTQRFLSIKVTFLYLHTSFCICNTHLLSFLFFFKQTNKQIKTLNLPSFYLLHRSEESDLYKSSSWLTDFDVILQISLALCLPKSKILCQGSCHEIDLCSQKYKNKTWRTWYS